MRLHHALTTLALLTAPVLISAQANLGTYEDRVAVEDVMARYVWTVCHGMAVQAAGGATREQLRRVAERAMRAWPADGAA